MTPRPVFSSYPFVTGQLAQLDRQFPSTLYAWDGPRAGEPLPLRLMREDATSFGYVDRGPAAARWNGLTTRLEEGQWFVIPGPCVISGGRGIVVQREGHLALPMFGGPIEYTGRLKYIDGCTDSLLAPPVKRGDPCLNLLYFPAGIDQTRHTHPSDRIGMILSGRGLCVVGDDAERVDLEPGMIFCIHTNGLHKFATPYGRDMRVLAYHPDSDFGPTDEEHPMINRTIVDGVPASRLAAIHTR